MSSLRRSARLAAKAESKTSVPTAPQELSKFVILTGAGSSGKSLFYTAFSSTKPWSLNYTMYPAGANMKDTFILNAAIVQHEILHREVVRNALSAYTTVWEYEMDVAARWLCIDNRILKESAEMRARAETYAFKVNDLYPALYSKINHLKKQLHVLEGRDADEAHQELLKANLLLAVADHAHEKWNIVMNEFDREQACLNNSDDEW